MKDEPGTASPARDDDVGKLMGGKMMEELAG
jgi:hypothetical protein